MGKGNFNMTQQAFSDLSLKVRTEAGSYGFMFMVNDRKGYQTIMTQLDKVNIISLNYSDETAKIIDKEISLLIESQYQKRKILEAQR
jgi:ATP-dependent Zn protease